MRKRYLLMLAGAVVGTSLALGLHMADSSPALSFATPPTTLPVTTTTRSTTTTTARPTTTSPSGSTTSSPIAPTTTTPPTTTTTLANAVRSATGPLVNYSFGQLAVVVTASGSHITKVTVTSLNDGGNPRSQQIDGQSIPILEQEALTAQSANIQGVSGASYTSAGFAQSLQGALTQLGL